MNKTFLVDHVVKPLHHQFFACNRLHTLSTILASFIPNNEKQNGLDIGCGSGELVNQLAEYHPHIHFTGVDIVETIKPTAQKHFNFQIYDGNQIPFPDNSFSFSLLADVLHHATDPKKLLSEAIRVSRDFILIKDHLCDSRWDYWRLRIMDYVGNRPYNVQLPYHYFSEDEWCRLFQSLSLQVEKRLDGITLYNPLVSLIFTPNLQFIVKLKITGNSL